MNLVNLTPHAVTLRNSEGLDTVVPPSGVVARVSTTPGAPVQMDGVPVPVFSSPTVGSVVGLGEPVAGTLFIVSGMVLAACGGRSDVVGPGTGPDDGAVRNDKGHIVAVTRLNAAPKGNP